MAEGRRRGKQRTTARFRATGRRGRLLRRRTAVPAVTPAPAFGSPQPQGPGLVEVAALAVLPAASSGCPRGRGVSPEFGDKPSWTSSRLPAGALRAHTAWDIA